MLWLDAPPSSTEKLPPLAAHFHPLLAHLAALRPPPPTPQLALLGQGLTAQQLAGALADLAALGWRAPPGQPTGQTSDAWSLLLHQMEGAGLQGLPLRDFTGGWAGPGCGLAVAWLGPGCGLAAAWLLADDQF
jgi:hypothetical protein